MGRTVSELQSTMTSREFVEWCAYERQEPGMPFRLDALAASIAAAVYNHRLPPEKRSPIKDFMVKFGDPQPEIETDPKALKTKMKMCLGGVKVKHGNRKRR